jgi:copper oxidase (laccase) domain-containing protein
MNKEIIQPSIRGHVNNIKYSIFGNVSNHLTTVCKPNMVVLEQMHSVMLNMVDDTIPYSLLGDGLFTKKTSLALGANGRDCMVVIIAGINFCGVVHIGWKNLYLGIIDKMFVLFQMENINISNLQFIIGPHITEKNMEVKFFDNWENHPYKEYGLSECFSQKDNKQYFSMSELFKNICKRKYNINEEQILKIPVDTYDNVHYASFRRSGLKETLTNFFSVEIVPEN